MSVNRVLMSVALLMAVIGFASGASAATSAGRALTNAVEVQYSDAGGNAACTPGSDCPTASLTVTVSLVASVSWGTESGTTTYNSGDSVSGTTLTVPLTNTSNGSVDVNVTSSASANPNVTGNTLAATTSVTLAGTTIASTTVEESSAPFLIDVQNISNAADFAGGDTIVIDGTEFTVATSGTSSDGDPATDDVLAVTTDPSTAVSNAGIGGIIGEKTDVALTGDVGQVTSNTNETYDITLNAANNTVSPALNQDSSPITITVQPPNITVNKYVRNVDTPNGTGTASTPDGGDTFFDGGVEGAPTETLEYLVEITNAGDGDATGVIFEDTLPSFTSLVDTSVQVDQDGCAAAGYEVTAGTGNPDTFLRDGLGTPGIVVGLDSSDTPTNTVADIVKLVVYAGTAGDEDTPTGGNIAGGSTAKSCIKYQVTVD